MHESAKRLLDAARDARSVVACSNFGELQKALAVSPARMTNWKARGVSKEGALKAQETLGCSANWVLTGVGEPFPGPSAPPAAQEYASVIPDNSYSCKEPPPPQFSLASIPKPPRPTLAEALAVLGEALAAELPDDVREDAADALAKLARRRGAVRDQQQVAQLLTQDQATGTTKRAA